MHTAMKAPTSSPKLFPPVVVTQFYRAEFNPLSGRWMVLSKYDECIQAGLCESAAVAYAETMNKLFEAIG